MSAARLQQWFPWVWTPVVCNGPMIGAACPALAAEVTKAGGIGAPGAPAGGRRWS